jgi:putative ABC transport system substrate-binding protein
VVSKIKGEKSMTKKILGWLLATVLLTTVSLAQAQQAGKIPRIGLLLSGSRSSTSADTAAFRQGLRDLGYVDEKNIAIEYRFAEGKFDRLSDLAAELVRLKVDVIVTSGGPPTRAAQETTKTIPIVMTVVGDPIEAGFIASLAKPGGNITGLTQISREVSGKRLELLKEAFPKISRVAVFVDGATMAQRTSESLQETQMVAKFLGIKLQSLEVRGPNPDLDGAFRTATSQRAGALIFLPGPVLTLHRKRVVDLAAKSRLPAIYSTEFVDVGGLMCYGPNYDDLYRRAATYVDKILKGRTPADLPVERPMKFEFVISLKAAKQIGVTIPPNVLVRADKVIQ